eukprot:TRINITY_DN4488_c0_g1_i3.p1 TRINITY_DN4488_c0_g1~~TRINITY_DN4488_c0_g1_i3.p1  ORF type:complete len:238 (-),score=90.37 TRINITY_DN4488_c0_g1_i3:148-861(-)
MGNKAPAAADAEMEENPAVEGREAASNQSANESEMSKFDLKQREVNEALRTAKDCIIIVRRCEGEENHKPPAGGQGGEDEGTTAKLQFNRSIKQATRLFGELQTLNKMDTSSHKFNPSISPFTAQTFKERGLLLAAFQKQLDEVKVAMKARATKRARPSKPIWVPPVTIDLTEEEREEAKAKVMAQQAVEPDQLADLPDLDPSSAAAYQEFCLKEEENQKKQEMILVEVQKLSLIHI